MLALISAAAAPAGATGIPDMPNGIDPSSVVYANARPRVPASARPRDTFSTRVVTRQWTARTGTWVARSVFVRPSGNAICVRIKATTDVVVRINPGALNDLRMRRGQPTSRSGDTLCWTGLNGSHVREVRLDYNATGAVDSVAVYRVTGRLINKAGVLTTSR